MTRVRASSTAERSAAYAGRLGVVRRKAGTVSVVARTPKASLRSKEEEEEEEEADVILMVRAGAGEDGRRKEEAMDATRARTTSRAWRWHIFCRG